MSMAMAAEANATKDAFSISEEVKTDRYVHRFMAQRNRMAYDAIFNELGFEERDIFFAV